MGSGQMEEALSPTPIMFDLGYKTKVHLLYSRVDGEPYIRLTREYPLQRGKMIHLNLENLKILMAEAGKIDKGLFDPEHKFRPFINLQSVGAQVKIKDLDPDFDDVVMLDLYRHYEDDPLLYSVKVHPVAWRNWQANFEKMSKWMQHVSDLKKRGKLQIPIRLNFKTLVEGHHYPPRVSFVREMQGKEDRKFSLPGYVMKELKKNLQRIDAAISYKNEVDIKLSGAYHVTTSFYNDKMYVSFGMYDEMGCRQKGIGMNIDVGAFKVLKDNMEALCECLDYSIFYKATYRRDLASVEEGKGSDDAKSVESGSTCIIIDDDADDEGEDSGEDVPGTCVTPKSSACVRMVRPTPYDKKRGAEIPPTPPAPKKLKACESRIPKILMYAWKYITKKDKVIKECPFWHFSEAFCRNDAEHNSPVNADNLFCTLECEELERPSERVLMRKLARHFITLEIRKKTKNTCLGCLYDSPGQRAHMDDGCLQEWETAVQKHLTTCVDAVDSTPFRCWLRNILHAMNYNCHGVQSLIEFWRRNLDMDELKEKISDEPVSESYDYFFTHLEPKD